MASPRTWSTLAEPATRTERQTGAPGSADRRAGTVAGIERDVHAFDAWIDTDPEPMRAYVADWAFWVRDAA